jgi:DNA-binding NarL/FixJ family response regulator
MIEAPRPMMHTTTGQVLVADDHLLVRTGIKLLISNILGPVDFVDAHDADSLGSALDAHAGLSLGVIDWRMPGMHDGQRLLEVSQRFPAIPLVVISAYTGMDVVQRALDIPSVYAFVAKSGSIDEVRSAVEAGLLRQKRVLVRVGGPKSAEADGLTPRQREIRNLVRQGMSNKMIAGTLGISEGTVKNHITEIFRALKATNRTQAAGLRAGDE